MKRIASYIVAVAAAAGMTAAHAQYPTRSITMVVPFAAGGPTDTVARTLGAAMSKALGQTVVVENKLGAGGTVAANYVAKANPDGYTIFIHHNGMATAVGLYRSLPYNPLTDFEYVGQVADVPMTLLARKDFPPATVKDLITYVKANKDKINLANAGLGAVSQLCGMLFIAIDRHGTHDNSLPGDSAGDGRTPGKQRGPPSATRPPRRSRRSRPAR